MEIFMRNVSFASTQWDVIRDIAQVLHGPDYASVSAVPLNFAVDLFRDRKGGRPHSGSGTLTLPYEEIGRRFLERFGGDRPFYDVITSQRPIRFNKSRNSARQQVVDRIRETPYLDPKVAEQEEKMSKELQRMAMSVTRIQFGWDCRDSSFSVEWEYSRQASYIKLDDIRRELRIIIPQASRGTASFAIRSSQIETVTISSRRDVEPSIQLTLSTPPSYQHEPFSTSASPAQPPPRQRLSALPLEDDQGIPHHLLAPYTSLALRLVCSRRDDLAEFQQVCGRIGIRGVYRRDWSIQRLALFSSSQISDFHWWLQHLDYSVAFQIESIVRQLAVDIKEMQGLRPAIHSCITTKGASYTARLLAEFGARAMVMYQDWSQETLMECFVSSQDEFNKRSQLRTFKLDVGDDSIFNCLHVNVTPTTLQMEGPFPERSNRVVRWYPNHHDCFLRVSFSDEDRLQLRFDPREIDGKAFIRNRFGDALLKGITVGGKKFEFLAYSQSALKEHTVYFMRAFHDDDGKYVDTKAIIDRLGNFHNLEFDRDLVRCPARYAARISQAFTATDISVSVEAEEIFVKQDITYGKYCFTDGNGSMSPEMAREIARHLRSRRRRAWQRIRHPPSAIQVRIQGAKGMLSVDHKLKGRVVNLRQSMIKFEAPDSSDIEICRVFDTPGRYFLNRPLITILENLGVHYNVFKKYQDDAVNMAREAVEAFESTAKLLDTHGLGTSYRLTSVILNLHKLGMPQLNGQKYRRVLEFAVHHVLRLLKHKARIPIPGAFTLVGVADHHGYLNEGEVYACTWPLDKGASQATYIEGPVLISRSPTIHPGDVQIARAIGSPPEGSPFVQERHANCVVFSTQGARPLPSCLGGGDLDGDEYNIIPLNSLPEFKPTKLARPGEYVAAPKRYIDHPSRQEDIAEFVMEYISSDVLGIIAITWQIIADLSPQGVFDLRCMKLSQLHSDAVDYPKSGTPVDIQKIPRLPPKSLKPDWNAPETINPDSNRFYRSKTAVGRLFRSIDLPAVKTLKTASRHVRRQIRDRDVDMDDTDLEDLEEQLNDLDITMEYGSRFLRRIDTRTSEFIPRKKPDHDETASISQLFQRYSLELQRICTTYSLSRTIMLTEEEAMVGTIVAQTSQPRRRKELMAKLREQTNFLVRGMREELIRDEDSPTTDYLRRAWMAWKVSLSQEKAFGAFSFGWIALGAVFEAIKEIEEENESIARRAR